MSSPTFLFDPPAYSLTDFQKVHNLHWLQFHKLRELGLAPQTVALGTKAYVMREAAAEWRQRITEYAAAHGGKIEL